MYQLKIGETVIAKSSTPFTFDDEHCLWISADYRLYDHSRVVEQVVEGEHEGAAFQRSSAQVPPAVRVSPVEFKLLFTSAERIAISSARINDPVIDDFYSIVENPRLNFVDLGLQSTQDALAYLQSLGLIPEERHTSILAGQLQ